MTGRELYEEYARIVKRYDKDICNGLVAYDHMLPVGRMIMDDLASFVNLHTTIKRGQTIDVQPLDRHELQQMERLTDRALDRSLDESDDDMDKDVL